ncbi:LysR family transcriptional regulator [Paenibacillus harenae]|uniref:LysR family transcriptional regulator n=1 Tax=Paenibacillus harenae TaxID=306543 RepID=UPI0003FFDE7B|nr:LysR family transcriptional regulator [Paenibacillus harenae]
MVENMEWYRVFYFAAKAGNLSRAAEELYITQPAVTHSIKQLESRLGGQLFFRTSKGVKLTHEGELLFKYIDQAFNFINTGERKMAELHQLSGGEIKIGAGDTLCKHYLLSYMEAFHQTYPAIKFQVTNRTTPETINLLKQGKIDFGIVNLPVQDPKIDIRESMRIEDCFIAGEKFRHLTEVPVSIETLAGYPILLLEKGSSTRAYIDGFTSRNGVTIKPEIELGSNDLLLEFTRTGFGIACVIKEFITKELDQSLVYEIKLTNPIPPRKIGIIKLKDVPLAKAASRFIELLPDA